MPLVLMFSCQHEFYKREDEGFKREITCLAKGMSSQRFRSSNLITPKVRTEKIWCAPDVAQPIQVGYKGVSKALRESLKKLGLQTNPLSG